MQRGKNVRVSYRGTGSTTSSQACSIVDADGVAYVLAPLSRLVLESIVVGANGANTLDLVNANAGATATSANINMGSFNAGSGTWVSHGEGLNCLKGVTPSILTSATGTFSFVAEAYVVERLNQTQNNTEPAVQTDGSA